MQQRPKPQILSQIMMVALLLLVFAHPGIAAEKIVLVGSEGTKASFTGRWLNLIYNEVFHRLNYQFEYLGYPNERANRMAESGQVDGEIQRAANYAEIAKNLLKVEEPSFLATIGAYAVKPGIVLDGWESLRNTSYIVEYRRGSKVPQTALPAVVKAENLSSTTTVERGLTKLIQGRIDIYIEQDYVVTEALGKLEPSPVYRAGIMWTGASHVYLHKRHAALLPKITKILKAMKQEGLVERYRQIAQEAG